MYINITLKIQGMEIDISVDNKQKIRKTLEILIDNLRIPIQKNKNPNFYLSQMQERVISSWFTFEEEKIVNGDCLISVD